MGSKTKKAELTLEDLNIYQELFEEEECPTELQEVFRLIYDVRSLEYDGFAAYKENEERNKAAHDYDKQLAKQAHRLRRKCCEPKRDDDSENEWVSVLKPVVFYRFHREEEERASYHHCFVCRLHYPFGSRPTINRLSARSTSRREDPTVGICQNNNHFNFPNFEMTQELTFINVGKENNANHNASYPWTKKPDLVENSRIKLFERSLLKELKNHFKIPPVYFVDKNRMRDSFPQFPFALWEAKKASALANNQTALHQSAPNVKSLLKWQQNFNLKADGDGCPVVWYFNSVGANWKVYGCFPRPSSRVPDGFTYVLMELWSGNTQVMDSALQLLYIVDIIAIWAEHNYKPFIGSCIDRLLAKKQSTTPPPDENTLLSGRLPINRINFQWIFDPSLRRTSSSERVPTVPRFSHGADSISRNALSVNDNDRSRRQSSRSPVSLPCPSLDISEPNHNPKFASGASVMPEIHDYTWFLDSDPDYGDLLIIRINKKGAVMRPFVVFQDAEWTRDQFPQILRHERKRQPSSILSWFNLDIAGDHYFWRGIFRSSGHLGGPDVQFCAILPLDRNVYLKERKNRIQKHQVFSQIESLLDVSALMANIEHALNVWCLCQAPWNDYSPPMIRCDNTKCKIEWYHKRCVGLDENFETDTAWFCFKCLSALEPPKWDRSDFMIDYDDDILSASDDRIQRRRTLADVWAKHDWPAEDSVLALFDEISCSIDIDSSIEYDVSKDGENRPDQGCWALSKHDPRKLSMVRLAANLERDTEYSVHDLIQDTSGLELSGAKRGP